LFGLSTQNIQNRRKSNIKSAKSYSGGQLMFFLNDFTVLKVKLPVLPNSRFFTLFHEIFYFSYNMDCFEYERFFVNKAHERLFLTLLAVHTGKKEIS
jgi:hypothetical protein